MLTVRKLQRPGLFPVSFQLDDGDCVAVQGPSGSGKTLLLRALADLDDGDCVAVQDPSGKTLLLRALADLDPNQGEVELDHRSRDAMSAPAWRRQVIYLPAESGWWSDRVADHVSDWEAAILLLEALLLPPAARDWSVQRLSTGER